MQKRSFGRHAVYGFDTAAHPFREFFYDLYGTQELNKLHMGLEEVNAPEIHDHETSLHKAFYREIKSNDRFKRLYCRLIQDIYSQFFSEEPYLIYQSFPSVRFQFINNVTVPPHCDSDDLGKHPIGERNFLLPITEMSGTKRLFIESAPGASDFAGIDLDYGELFYFDGNKCIHYNEKNIETTIRISLDFRVLTPADYLRYIAGNTTSTNPRDPEGSRKPTKMIVGGYYQLARRGESVDSMMRWHFQPQMLLQSMPNFDNAEATACYEYMKDGKNFVTEFKKTAELEAMFAAYTGAKHVIMTTSGNTALILALMAAGIGAGDSVLVPNYTMIATVNSVRFVGATPIIVDVDPTSLTLSLEALTAARTANTKAVLHVSLNNRHAGIKDIAEYCKTNGLILLEDAAQSLGCTVDGVHFGRYGDIGCFSLSTPKIISTGQGGFLITDNDEYARKINMIKNFGRRCGGVDDFEVFGVNAKFTDLQAVVGIEQMKKLPGRVPKLRAIFDAYYSELSPFMRAAPFETWIPWFVDIFVERRDELVEYLKKHNVQTRPTYPMISSTPMYETQAQYPISKYVSEHGLFLPTHTHLKDEEIRHICGLILLFFSA